MRKFLHVLFFVLLITFCLAVSLHWLLPAYLNNRIVPDLKKRYSLSGFKGHVQSIALTSTVAGPFSVSDGKGFGLFVDSVEIRYALPQLLTRRRIDQITVYGLRLDLTRQGKGLVGKGEGLSAFRWDKHGEGAGDKGIMQLPFNVEKIDFPHALVTIWDGEKNCSVPVSLRIFSEATSSPPPTYRFELTASAVGQRLSMQGRIDPGGDLLSFAADSWLDLPLLTAFLESPSGLTVSGRAQVHGEGRMTLSSPALEELAVQGRLFGVSATRGSIGIEVLSEKKEGAATLTLNGRGDSIRLLLPDCRINGKIPFLLQGLQMEGKTGDGDFSGELTGKVVASPGKEREKAAFSPQLEAFFQLFFALAKDGSWRLGGKVPGPGKVPMQASAGSDFGRVSLAGVEAQSSGQGTADQGSFDYQVRVPIAAVKGHEVEIKALGAFFSGRVNGALRQGNLEVDHDGKIELPDVSVSAAEGSIAKASLILGHKASLTNAPFSMGGRLSLTEGEFDYIPRKILLKGVAAEIPLRWPVDSGKGEAGEGSFVIGDILFEDEKLANLSGKIALSGSGYSFDAVMHSPILPVSLIKGTGEVAMAQSGIPDSVQAEFQVPAQMLREKSSRLLGLPFDMKVGGEVSGEAAVQYGRGACLTAMAAVNVQSGSMEIPSKQLKVTRLQVALSFDDLPRLRSAPARLQFAGLDFGEYRLGGGRVDFQIESANSLLIEKGRFKWAGGTVHALAVRLSSDSTDFTAELYCDRLNLAELLKQFGIKNASGDGSVNGSIPLQYKDGKISFEDGFLYSTPGGGGNIRVRAMDQLTAGIPADSPQFTQLDFAGAALADFNYNWAKLSVSSEAEDVVLRMTLDGRPNKPLPFRYDQKLGTFSRLTASTEQGIDQPIVLDVNFRIPFNELLGYGKSIKQVLDLMQ